ncbi:hypothetical protein B0O99DRAFT_300662 [Bisporella sp. PMI_857]|jgi:hypothetical protein|nr:hypothetical protein B0O99DRAFT_300662 [Bisporella sp. PMI_857]
MPSNGKPNGRFELPALAPIDFSLTDGTNIPPPPASPIEEKPPPTTEQSKPSDLSLTTSAPPADENAQERGRTSYTTNDHPPLSPASTGRPSSIRRFLSRKSLNANYTNGTNHNISSDDLTAGTKRPESPSSFFEKPGLKKSKSGSWFKRLGSSNRQSVIYENEKNSVTREEEKKGPPPPKLPELSQFNTKVANNAGGFGDEDMFKNIK